jgi:hypothetical protein
MTLQRGNKKPRSRALREKRTAQALGLMRLGAPMVQIAKALGCSRDTLWRNLKAAKSEYVEKNADAIAEAVKPVIARAVRGDLKALRFLMDVFDSRRPQDLEEV